MQSPEQQSPAPLSPTEPAAFLAKLSQTIESRRQHRLQVLSPPGPTQSPVQTCTHASNPVSSPMQVQLHTTTLPSPQQLAKLRGSAAPSPASAGIRQRQAATSGSDTDSPTAIRTTHRQQHAAAPPAQTPDKHAAPTLSPVPLVEPMSPASSVQLLNFSQQVQGSPSTHHPQPGPMAGQHAQQPATQKSPPERTLLDTAILHGSKGRAGTRVRSRKRRKPTDAEHPLEAGPQPDQGPVENSGPSTTHAAEQAPCRKRRRKGRAQDATGAAPARRPAASSHHLLRSRAVRSGSGTAQSDDSQPGVAAAPHHANGPAGVRWGQPAVVAAQQLCEHSHPTPQQHADSTITHEGAQCAPRGLAPQQPDTRRTPLGVEPVQGARVKQPRQRVPVGQAQLQEGVQQGSDDPQDRPVKQPRQLRRERQAPQARSYPEGVFAADDQDPRVSVYVAPPSPFSLLEEVLYDDPWKLLLACILLNKTSGKLVRRVLGPLFRLFPTPCSLAQAGGTPAQEQLQHLLHPLGLFRKRAAGLVRFSQEYLQKQWRDPRELHLVGVYGADAYALFCRGAWSVMDAPYDKDLHKYWTWLKSTHGQGEGLQRESLDQILGHTSDPDLTPQQQDAGDACTDSQGTEGPTTTSTTTN